MRFVCLLTWAALGVAVLASTACCGAPSGNEETPGVTAEPSDFSGTYEVFRDEGPTYTLTISGFQNGYKLKWETADGESWQGTAFAFEGVLAVETPRDPGYFGFYEKQGSKLSGIFTTLEGKGYFTERSPGAKPLRPSTRNLSGKYNVIGFDALGEGYEDIYYIKRSGQTYNVLWRSLNDPVLTAAGICSGDFFVAGVGIAGSIVTRIYKIEGTKLNGRYFYVYYDEENSETRLVSNGETAEKD